MEGGRSPTDGSPAQAARFFKTRLAVASDWVKLLIRLNH